jgi:hypothetical protein
MFGVLTMSSIVFVLQADDMCLRRAHQILFGRNCGLFVGTVDMYVCLTSATDNFLQVDEGKPVSAVQSRASKHRVSIFFSPGANQVNF